MRTQGVIRRYGAALSVLFSSLFLFSGVGVSASSESDTPDRIDILVAVDESASLTSAAVRAEKDALRAIIQSPEVRHGGIRIGVLPFSSGKNSPRRLSACELTKIDDEGIEQLLLCVDQIVRKQKKGQSDTDFAGVIDAAVSDFGKTDATRVILLLTDGKYDPDGDEMISPSEKAKIDESLANAKKNRVSLWAVGFGKADKAALDEYVGAGDGGDKNCASRPEAVIANVTDLSTEMQRIIDFATCTGGSSGPANPKFEFVVNPLLSKINIEVTASASLSSSAVDVTNSAGSPVCEDAEIEDGRWLCTESVGGDDGGIWTVTSTAKGAQARVTWNGAVNIQVVKCLVDTGETPSASIKVSRADGQTVDFDFDGDAQWPQVIATLSDGKGQTFRTNEIELNREFTEILGIDEVPIGASIDVEFNRDVPEEERLLIRADQVSNCVVGEIAAGTTTTAPSAVAPTTTIDSRDNDDTPPSPPVWPWILAGIALLAAGGFAATKLSGKKFPDDAELFVRNPINQSVYNSVELIGGQRKVYFDIESGRNGASVLITSKQEARYLLTLADEESIQVKSLWKPEKVDEETDDGDDQTSILAPKDVVVPGTPINPLVGEPFNVRECDSDSAPNRLDAVYLKVDWPEQ
jgi:hypothetical protein